MVSPLRASAIRFARIGWLRWPEGAPGAWGKGPPSRGAPGAWGRGIAQCRRTAGRQGTPGPEGRRWG